MPRTRKGTNASPSRSPPRPSAAGESPRSRGPDLSEDGDAAVARFSALVDRMQAAEDDQPPAADDDRDEVMIEASAKSAVTAVEAADPNATLLQPMKDMEAIECAVLEFAFFPANRVPTEARTFFANKVVESYAVCSRVTCEASRQSALASLLRRQLAEARREAAELRLRLAVAEARLGGLVVSVDGLERGGRGPAVLAGGVSAPSAAGGSAGSPAGRMDYAAALRTGLAPSAGAARGGPGAVAAAAAAAGRPGALHKHVAFLTPVSTTATPARDVLRLLKSKVDPRAQNIRDVTLHHTRYGLTVFTDNDQSLANLEQAIAADPATRASILMRVAPPRNPCVKFTGVDPDIGPDDFLRTLNECNEGLDLDLDRCKVRVTFGERAGARSYVAELDPDGFRRVMSRPRLTVGWTSVRAREDLHVPTCTFCATYGHGRTTCPHKADPTKARCLKCGSNHLAATCRVKMGAAEVHCRGVPTTSASWENSRKRQRKK
ncbi:uncharacterized protein [Dermacentor albipictus]|uniref:uncharacterized protein n=1 Tax=Dermacentor albipictus TaxID=60249 RepID=UPI0038FD077F